MKIKNLFKGEGFVNFSSSILAIVCGLLFGLIILLISNPSQAFGGFMMIIQGGFTDGMQGFGQVLYMATPLIVTGRHFWQRFWQERSGAWFLDF